MIKFLPLFLAAAIPASAQGISFGTLASPPTATATGDTAVLLAWTGSNVSVTTADGDSFTVDVTGYVLAHSMSPITAGNFGEADLQSVAATGGSGHPESLPFPALYRAGRHYFAIKATYDGETSPLLGTASVVVIGDITPPDAVGWGSPALREVTSSTVTIAWLPGHDGGATASGIQEYEIRASRTGPIDTIAAWGQAPEGPILPVPATGPHPTSIVLGGLQDSTVYWFAVCAIDRGGNAGPPNAVSLAATTAATPPPEAGSGSGGCSHSAAVSGATTLLLPALILLLRRTI